MPNAPRQFRMTPPAPRHQHEKQWKSRQTEHRDIYQTPEWKELRPLILHRDNYMCQACLRRGIENVLPKRADKKKGQESADVDHIIPLKVKPQLAYDPENLQTLCHSCHSRKTRVEMNHGRRVVVTGPPNSGKTTHVKQNAKQGATIWDADDIVKVMTGRGRHDWPEHMMAVIPAMLNALVQTMQMNDCPELWIIVTDKHRARQIALMLGAEVVEKTER